MTLSQLRAFALVARLGSMRAAASALGISEPAVSAAIAALRADLGDALVVRSGGGIALTAGGRRLAAHADEIVGLADRARREVTAAGTSSDLLRVAVTPAFEEHAAGALLDTFTARSPGVRVELHPIAPERLAAALLDHDMDLALGGRPSGGGGAVLEVVPFLRYQRVVVVARGHRLSVPATVHPSALLQERWLAGPGGVEELSEESRWLVAAGLLPELHCRRSEAEALDEVRAGKGLSLALSHVVRADLHSGALVAVRVTGTPVQGLWCASTLGQARSVPAARALQRFCTTPDAVAAMVALRQVPRQRRQTVHVTLWS